jgi:hypothetical protein
MNEQSFILKSFRFVFCSTYQPIDCFSGFVRKIINRANQHKSAVRFKVVPAKIQSSGGFGVSTIIMFIH